MKMLLEIVNEILLDSGRESVDRLEPQMRLREDLGLDSLELAVMTANIEAQTGVDVFEHGIVSTIGEVVQRIESSES